MAGPQGTGGGAEGVQGSDGPHDLRQLGGEAGALDDEIGGEHLHQRRVRDEGPPVEVGGDTVEVERGQAVLDKGDLRGCHLDISAPVNGGAPE